MLINTLFALCFISQKAVCLFQLLILELDHIEKV